VADIIKPTQEVLKAPAQKTLSFTALHDWEFPSIEHLQAPSKKDLETVLDERALQRNADLLQQILADFNVEGEIVKIRPGPVVTLYEFEPAAGVKSSRVIGLADDIARSMSAVSVRAAVVPGRNVIGIEIPNQTRQIVYLRSLLESTEYSESKAALPMVLGKDIGGKPVIADLAKMPHLLVAGTTGSGKSVAVNTMIMSLVYCLPPEKCRLIMIDPKMLELSVYDDIPHLLSPVVTDPGRAVVALKWAVQEMENRYRAMSKFGVRNIDGYNKRIQEAIKNNETLSRKVQTGFDPESGKPVFEEEAIALEELPYIVVIVDEFADLMLVAGKDVESAIQRLAQMARAAGIHLIMATQRPSVDVITGVIKANFPTRISFQVTSKFDSRTILGDGGAEQLLGMGDMLYMASGGKIQRVHGPFVADDEVEHVVTHLKEQGEPAYLDTVTDSDGEGGMGGLFGENSGDGGSAVDELYDQAVALVAREQKASTSFIQRHLQIGYNRAARIIEEMEKQGVVGPANHVGKREVQVSDHSGDFDAA
jgi:S-DNA-T family DNA segregation ATPase FtsK/SpoIIIE